MIVVRFSLDKMFSTWHVLSDKIRLIYKQKIIKRTVKIQRREKNVAKISFLGTSGLLNKRLVVSLMHAVYYENDAFIMNDIFTIHKA